MPPFQAAALGGMLGVTAPVDDGRLAALMGLEALLAAAAEEAPLLGLIDDAQWLDGDSRDAIFFAARRVASSRVAIIVAQQGAGPKEGIEELALPPLPRGAAAELARARAPAPLGEPELERILDRAAGLPLAIEELVTRDDGGERVLDRLYGADIAALSSESRIAVLTVAVSNDDRLDAQLAAAAALGAGEQAWEAAEAAGVLALGGGRATFVRDGLRDAMLRHATPGERRTAHRALADALDARDEATGAARHRAAATIGYDDVIADRLEAAAEEFTRRSGHVGAAEALEDAARLTTSATLRARRLVAAAEQARRAHRNTQADKLAAEALSLADDPAVRDRAELVRAGVEAWHGHLADAGRRYREIARRARERDPATASMALSYAAGVEVVRGDTAAALVACEGALAEAEAAGSAPAALAARETLASVLVLRGEIATAREPLDAVLAHYAGTADHTGAEYVGLTCAWIGEYERAAALLDSAVTAAESLGDIRHLAQALEIRADLRFRRGDWDGALTDAARSADRADVAGEPVQLAYSLATQAILHAARGERDQAHARVKRARTLVQGRGVRVLEEYTGYALALLALGDGDPQTALEQLLPVADHVGTTGRGLPGILFWNADLIEAAVATGERDLAATLSSELVRQAEETQVDWALGAAARCRGWLADDHALDPHFQAAIALHEPTPFERARSRLAYGHRLRLARRLRDSRSVLEAARDEFARLGARAWAERADAELQATGQRYRNPSGGTGAALTETEIVVARHVAEGHANKMIAFLLGVKEKAIERHLTSIFKKAGVTNRLQLARWVHENPGAVRPGPVPDEPASGAGEARHG
jgi:DNA-binding CsgD family transcriptional regulator/tetratricopeptide (TPR) repeat protein